MPVINNEYSIGLKPLIDPFEGHPRKTRNDHLLEGEKHNDEFMQFIHDGRDNSFPNQFSKHLLVTKEEISLHKIDLGNSYPLKCFLWVIDSVSLKIIWEMTPNLRRKPSRPDKPYVCHTNITGSGKAYIGGEMYFCVNESIIVNFASDRYGYVSSEENKQMAIRYMKDCNYKNIIRADFEALFN